MAKQSLEDWIHEARIDGDPKLGGMQPHHLTHFVLAHMVGGGGVGGMQKEVGMIRLGGGKAWGDAELASHFRRRAENYCQDAPGVQYFTLIAFYGDEGCRAEMPFLVNSQPENGGFFSEGPDPKGEKQQAMRHLEMAQQQVYAQQQHLNIFLSKTIANLTAERHEVMGENREMFTIMKEMMAEKATSDHERTMKQLAFQRSTAQRNQLLKMVPPLVNTVTGKNVFPVETADTALIESIADSFDPNDESMGEKISQLAGLIKPELLGPLMTRLQAHMQKRREEQAAMQGMVAPGDPEKDAAGEVH